jgi:hypothetical protein
MLVSVLARISVARKLVFPCVRGESFESFREATECEHCHTKRNRNELFVVEVDGKRMTLGARCLEKMIGKEKSQEAFKVAREGEAMIKLGLSEFSISLDECIEVAHEIIQKYGFVSCYEARISDDASTAYRIRNPQGTGTELRPQSQWARVAEEVKDFVKSLSDESDFITNAKILFGYRDVFAKELGIVCAVVNMWIKHEQSKGAMIGAEWVGEEGERIKKFNMKAKVKFLGSQDSGYGIFHKYLFECENGLVLSWNTSTLIRRYLEDEVMIEAFTVKYHTEWKSRGKLTVVTRMKYQVLKSVDEE